MGRFGPLFVDCVNRVDLMNRLPGAMGATMNNEMPTTRKPPSDKGIFSIRRKRAGEVFPALALLLLFLPCVALGSQTVSVVYQPPESMSLLDARREARELAFVQACLNQAGSLLSQPLNQDRQEALRGYLAPMTGQLVQGYTDLDFQESNGIVTLQTRVNINEPELKRMLKELGIFYTAGRSLPYTLLTSGFTVQDLEKVLTLQLLTGLDPRSGADLTLQLEKLGDNHWRAVLGGEDLSFAVESLNLETAWKQVWGRYFSGDTARTPLSRRMVLTVRGWTTTEGLRAFDHLLGGWQKVLDEAQLLEVSLEPDTTAGSWLVTTLDPAGLKQRVAEFAGNRALTFSIEEPGAAQQVQGSLQPPVSRQP